jgi:hypothetical protein
MRQDESMMGWSLVNTGASSILLVPRRSARAATVMLSKSGIAMGVSAMSGRDADAVFAGSVPELYDTYMVPLIFAPYAADLASQNRSQSALFLNCQGNRCE